VSSRIKESPLPGEADLPAMPTDRGRKDRIEPRRIVGSVMREFFLVVSLKKNQEAEGHEAQGDVMVKSCPRSSLEVIEPQLFLELPVPFSIVQRLCARIIILCTDALFGEVGDSI
jgi:hypothetical protein